MRHDQLADTLREAWGKNAGRRAALGPAAGARHVQVVQRPPLSRAGTGARAADDRPWVRRGASRPRPARPSPPRHRSRPLADPDRAGSHLRRVPGRGGARRRLASPFSQCICVGRAGHDVAPSMGGRRNDVCPVAPWPLYSGTVRPVAPAGASALEAEKGGDSRAPQVAHRRANALSSSWRVPSRCSRLGCAPSGPPMGFVVVVQVATSAEPASIGVMWRTKAAPGGRAAPAAAGYPGGH
jgi:hypothetical protein